MVAHEAAQMVKDPSQLNIFFLYLVKLDGDVRMAAEPFLFAPSNPPRCVLAGRFSSQDRPPRK
jgi:hypothetical protein